MYSHDPRGSTAATGVMESPIWGQEVETAVTSFVIGDVTLQEDVKNPPVPSGMQKFEITYNTPITREEEEEKFRYRIAGLQILSYPFEFAISLYNATQGPGVAVSEDRMTLTGMVDLPAGATYQMLISPNDFDPVDCRHSSIFGAQKNCQMPKFLVRLSCQRVSCRFQWEMVGLPCLILNDI